MTSIAFRGNTAMIRRQFTSLLTKVSANSAGNHFFGGYTSIPAGAQTCSFRTFSNTKVGSITTQLNKLDADTVRKIEDELHLVDKDSDGRYVLGLL